MKINKKIIMLFILFVLLAVPIYQVSAAKLECNEIPVDFCPAPGIDANGNACTKGYYTGGTELVCKKKENPQNCAEIHTSTNKCPEVDDYGNTCKSIYPDCIIEKLAVYKELKTCEEYTYQEGCPTSTGDYKGNQCAIDTNGKCYIKEYNTPCSELKDSKACDSKADRCRWIMPDTDEVYDSEMDNGVEKHATDDMYNFKPYCTDIVQPTDASPACSTITHPAACQERADCGYLRTSKTCVNRSDYAKIVNGTEIEIEEVKFKCSDVKYLTNAWLLIRIAAPFIIILFGSLDFFKSIVAGDEKKMKESRGKFIKRLIAFVLLILLPFIIQLIFSTMGTYGSDNVCLLKCIATNNTSSKGCD